MVAVVPALNYSPINHTYFPETGIGGFVFLNLTEDDLQTEFHVHELATRKRIMMLIIKIQDSVRKLLIYIGPMGVSLYIVLAYIARSKGSNSTLTILIAL